MIIYLKIDYINNTIYIPYAVNKIIPKPLLWLNLYCVKPNNSPA